MNLNNVRAPLNEVLYEFALAQPTPDADLLERYVRRYPEHAGALTDLAIGIVLDAARGEDDEEAASLEPAVSPAVSRAMSRFQNRLFEVQQKPAPAAMHANKISAPADNPFATLSRQQFRSLAQQLHGNTVFLTMLRDREIDAKTITPGFTKLVADEMQVPADLLAAHFAAQTEIPSGQYYKASEKPKMGPKISFAEAVRLSGLTQEQQEFLLSL